MTATRRSPRVITLIENSLNRRDHPGIPGRDRDPAVHERVEEASRAPRGGGGGGGGGGGWGGGGGGGEGGGWGGVTTVHTRRRQIRPVQASAQRPAARLLAAEGTVGVFVR